MLRIVMMLLALVLGASTAAAVPEKPRLRLIGVADGLPSSSIMGLAVDRAGYLWIATTDGLARYDGVGMRVWRHVPDDPRSLPGNYVTLVHVDAQDRVWVAIEGRGLLFRWLYADFGLWNTFPAAAYEEGGSYPAPPFEAKHRITARRGSVADGVVLDHLTTSYVSLKPGRGVGPRSKLLLAVDAPRYVTGPEASALTVSRTGKVRWFVFQLNSEGNGTLKVPFGKGRIARVVLVLTNASTRTRCWVDQSLTYSCAGAPKDDLRAYRYSAVLIP